MALDSPLDKARTRSYPAIRIAMLRERGTTLAAIAEQLGVGRSWLSHVNAGRYRSPKLRVERAIARALGLSLRQAFPELADDERAA
jgi:transcriptional regulator with XRE-family HTH domain